MFKMKPLLSLLPLATLAFSDYQIPFNSNPSPSTLDAIPLLGFGTWNLKQSNTSEAVSYAIRTGYRHIDAAAAYGNEEEVGRGIADGLKQTGLSREDLWITSKLWNDRHDPSKVESALDTSLKKLGLEFLDLYHMHWPVAFDLDGSKSYSYIETWKVMTTLQQQGKARHIGISNFSPAQILDLLNRTSVPPQVHQMELHPYLPQRQWIDFHKERGIHVTAYSPLGGTNPVYHDGDDESPVSLLRNDVVGKVARKRNCSPAQVVLQWGMARGTSVIPKSIHKNHIEDNSRAPECMLKEEDLEAIDGLGKYHHRYNNPSKSWGLHLYEGLEDDDGTHGGEKFWDEAW